MHFFTAYPNIINKLKPWMILPPLGLLIYFNSLWNPFIFDDHIAIIDNPVVRALWPPTWLTSAWSPEKGAQGRPVVNLTLALNYHIGQLNVFGYHLVNLFLHMFNALILCAILRHTFQSPNLNQRYGQTATRLSLIIATLWLVHPLHTQCLNYLTQRSELLMGTFYLLTMYCSIRAFQNPKAPHWIVLSILSCALGMASKEVMVSTPFVVLLYHRTFFSNNLRTAILNKWTLYAGLASTWIILLILLSKVPHGDTIGFATPLTGWAYLKNQCIALTTYLKLVIWPHPLILDYGFPDPHLPFGDVAPQAILLVCLIMGTVVALKKHPAIGFLGACFFLILAPTSSIIPIVNEVAAERRMYLPLVACLILIVMLFDAVIRTTTYPLHFKKRLIGIATTLSICILSVLTIQRNQDHQTEQKIWETVIQHNPTNPRAWNILGHLRFEEKAFEASIPFFEKSLEQKPDFFYAQYNMAHALTELGRPEEALPFFTKAVELDPDEDRLENWVPKIHNNLGIAFLKQEQYQKAIAHFRKVITIKPDHYLAHNNLGVALLHLKNYQEALREFQEALRINSNYAGAQSNIELTQMLINNQ